MNKPKIQLFPSTIEAVFNHFKNTDFYIKDKTNFINLGKYEKTEYQGNCDLGDCKTKYKFANQIVDSNTEIYIDTEIYNKWDFPNKNEYVLLQNGGKRKRCRKIKRKSKKKSKRKRCKTKNKKKTKRKKSKMKKSLKK